MDNKCIICMDSKNIHVNCIQCLECQICYECYHLIYESSSKCPICRVEDWEVEKINLYEIITFIKLKNSFESFFLFFDSFYYYKKHISNYWDRIYE